MIAWLVPAVTVAQRLLMDHLNGGLLEEAPTGVNDNIHAEYTTVFH